jgi:hypothetical protein
VKLTTYSRKIGFFDHFIEILIYNTNKRVYFLLHKGIKAGGKSHRMTKILRDLLAFSVFYFPSNAGMTMENLKKANDKNG